MKLGPRRRCSARPRAPAVALRKASSSKARPAADLQQGALAHPVVCERRQALPMWGVREFSTSEV